MTAQLEEGFIPASEIAKLESLARAEVGADFQAQKSDVTGKPDEPLRKSTNLAMAQFLLGNDPEANRKVKELGLLPSQEMVTYALAYEGPQQTEIIMEGALYLGHALYAGIASDSPGLPARLAKITESRWSQIEDESWERFPWLGVELFLIQIMNNNSEGVLALLDEHESLWVEFDEMPRDNPELAAVRSLCEGNLPNFNQGVKELRQKSSGRLSRTSCGNHTALPQIIHPGDLFDTFVAALFRAALKRGMAVNPLSVLPLRTARLWGFSPV